ncbi:methyltransferase domain-containing protein [Pararhizobium sp. YC-54]|uniref:class I SAM-dependent methyltransferase n=1 Tax=Pararhizobium sp. YC-54 TaxID=2986920 RepID=UPI0021F6C0BF|nr:methyltransferase domain-containing protein [Pararhizobium sp. YC-54]MCV9998681.1 methyltransferase domain-containing protein [Pararhizobium sp. YC-54]
MSANAKRTIVSSAAEEKLAEIVRDPEQTAKHLRDAAKSIVDSRVAKRFYDDCYALAYSASDLERRPFLNIGPGSFRHPMWRTADKKYGDDATAWTEMRRGVEQPGADYNWDIYSGQQMQEADGFFKVIYTSHVIEHLFPQDVLFLLKEARRLLEPGGRIRIVCPDATLMVDAYIAQDWQYFLHYLIVKTKRLEKPAARLTEREKREISATFLVEWVSLLTNKQNPKTFSAAECVTFLDSFTDLYDAFDAAGELSLRDVNITEGGHVNWFNARKLTLLLKSSGFSAVKISGFQQSSLAILRDGRFFDRTDPEMSLFVEATA